MLKKLTGVYEVKDQCSTTLRGKLKGYKDRYKNNGLSVDTQNLWLHSNTPNEEPTAVKIFMETDETVVFLKAQKSNSTGRVPGDLLKEIRTLSEVEKNVQELLNECTEFLNQSKEDK